MKCTLTSVLSVILAFCASAQSAALAKATEALYRGEYGKAAELAEQQIRDNPKAAPARVLLARAELAQGKLLQALEQLKVVLARGTSNVDAFYFLSVVAGEPSRH